MNDASVDVRPATGPDLDAILELERHTPQAPHWSRRTYENILAMESPPEGLCRLILVATEPAGAGVPRPAGILGFAVVALLTGQITSPGLPAELESIVVEPANQRRGVGRALMQAVLAWAAERGARSIELEVRAGNNAALGLYRAFEFAEVARRPKYYSDPDEDAVLMRASFGQGSS